MLTPNDPTWFSQTQAALIISDPQTITWDETADVVVAGFGGAGVCTAIEAADEGASVIAIDRFNGGGATAISGGVTYLGGGTDQQQEAGVDDSPEEMFNYLKMETLGVVKDETLRHFCDTSRETQQWLCRQGVQLRSSLCPVKTSYPAKPYYLYYSGNEPVPEYAAKAKPAQRGHRACSPDNSGFAGPAFYDPLKQSALAKGVRFFGQSRVKRLVISSGGEVFGVEISRFPDNHPLTKKHSRFSRLATKTRLFIPALARYLTARMDVMENDPAVTIQFIRAYKGVVIATGGFVQNRKMLRHYAPEFGKAMPLGDTACDGSGIRLGQTAGGAVKHMERVSAWRFINPPMALAKGIVVNGQGQRFCNEQVYGAKLGYHMVAENGGRAIVVINAALFREAIAQVLSRDTWYFQALPMVLNFLLKRVKAGSVETLAKRYGMNPAALQNSIATYNRAANGEQPDAFGKSREFLASLAKGPYYGFDISIDSKTLPCATVTFGGLVVDEETGQVMHESGTLIKGLYAAGRAAVGIPSNFYVSGLSIADCVFSGRRAGYHCARCR